MMSTGQDASHLKQTNEETLGTTIRMGRVGLCTKSTDAHKQNNTTTGAAGHNPFIMVVLTNKIETGPTRSKIVRKNEVCTDLGMLSSEIPDNGRYRPRR